MRIGVGSIAAAMVSLVVVQAASALSPADKCEAAKNAIAGKYAFCRQNAEAKAIKKGDSPDYSKCDATFAGKWMKAEAKGGCPTTGDQAAQKATLTTNASRTTCQLSGQTRFQDNGDGTITDRKTCLMWEKKIKLDGSPDYANLHDADDYYPWSGYCSVSSALCQATPAASAACTAAAGSPTGCAECAGGEGTCTLSYAGGNTVWDWLLALNAANFATHNDWRVPTRDELQSLIDYTDSTAPVVDVAFQGAMCGVNCGFMSQADCSCTLSGAYVTASPYGTNPAYGWSVGFNDGSLTYFYKNYYNYSYSVRAVRGGS